jgi:NAD(P)-dependent dehydrogenase (short-subunit alcohol dehydrogenase family)
VNVKGTFLVSQAAARAMQEAQRPGVIVMLSSQMGKVGDVHRTVYCATKHAVEGLTKAMAVELAPDGIRVVAVAPTYVRTPLTEPFLADQRFRENVLSRIPLGRLGEARDVAEAVVFLASSSASLITGTSLVIDGGWTAR